ncbi:MAG TPA: TIM44-like domain-containing protein [Thiotrichales bacterium]|nr:TIM44-like domain-containing protein [Thiotrichales bacterium]
MKAKLFSVAMALLVSVSMVSTEAFAKRMGSGSNSGMQRDVAPASPAGNAKSAPTSPAQQPAAAGATGTAAGAAAKPSMMGPLMGLAAGGLLAAAFMGGAFEGISAMDIILLLLIAGGVIFFLRRRAQQAKGAVAMPMPATATPMPNQQYRQAEPMNTTGSAGIQIGSHVGNSVGMAAMMGSNYPTWFDEAKFVKQAETWYVALQSAWDNQDWTTLSSLSTPELFAQLKAQRSAEADDNQTRVEEVRAQVREMSQDANGWVLTVQFTGYVSEQAGAFAHAFNEFWHLVRIGEADGEWKLAGIQQA